jgi:hypothetical protein
MSPIISLSKKVRVRGEVPAIKNPPGEGGLILKLNRAP